MVFAFLPQMLVFFKAKMAQKTPVAPKTALPKMVVLFLAKNERSGKNGHPGKNRPLYDLF